MTGRTAQLRSAARFASGLYLGEARGAYDAYVRRNLFARLRYAPGRDDPYPIYEQIRAGGTFYTTAMGNLATADHAACKEILRSRRWGVQPEGEDPPPEFDLSFLDRNPPDHTRLRRIAAPAFSPRRIAELRTGVEKTVERLLDDAERTEATTGRFDLVPTLAAPLPIAVICDLLGIPDADTATFSRYGAALGSALSGIRSLGHARAVMEADAAIERLFTDLFERRRREPADDLVSELVAAEDAEQVRPAEMVPLCSLLLVAGFETTVNLVGNAVNALLDHPEQWGALVDDPGLAGAAVQETLRWDGPVQRTTRVSFDDTEVGGTPVARGRWVNVLIGGADRDPAVFAHADRFDLTRTDGGDHLAFSSGIHHCVGRPLAELEATVAIRQLAERMPSLRRAGAVRRRNATVIRGPVALPVACR
ncbi:cytochrome P450 [Nocardioides mangrovi]|uniref:Cytochrome P450 n=1 Tax=Nocardioides mangrovi TaxID=2874580 RepID=A0ABS7UJL3_9ACTN|nr:cytochrome P450 [Nocardioides mangrovi]MBZ5741206.1 cytochrome P450 [Nocardioides mangrovi]